MAKRKYVSALEPKRKRAKTVKTAAPANTSKTATPAKTSNTANTTKTTKTSAASKSATHKTTTHFQFLALPAELRSRILELAARNSGTGLLSRRSRGHLSSADAIALVNKQLREEYLGVLYGHAATVVAHVLDFDFRHVVTFYNKLNAGEVKALPAKRDATVEPKARPQGRFRGRFGSSSWNLDRGSSRKAATSATAVDMPQALPDRQIKILLDFRPHFDWRDSLLDRWLNRLTAVGKIGTDAKIVYEAYSYKAMTEWEGYRSLPWPLGWDLMGARESEKRKIAGALAAKVLMRGVNPRGVGPSYW